MSARKSGTKYTWTWLGAALVILVSAGVCVRLGVWQLARLSERQHRNAEIESRMKAPPLPLEAVTDGDSLAYRRVVGAGVFDLTRQTIEVGRSQRGIPGVVVVTPVVFERGRAMLVERGWVASPDARSVDLIALDEPDSTEITGILLRPGDDSITPRDGWPLIVRYANPQALQARYPYPLRPWVLRRLEVPSGAHPSLEPAPLPELSEGPHLSYAVQWFSFALIALVGGAAAAWRRTHPRSPSVRVADPPY